MEDVKIYTTVNRNDHGKITEIYITTDREGTLIMGLLNSLSKTISVMLQYHIPPQNISKMLRGQKYEPYGFVSRHPFIKYCTSISDLISKIIDIEIGDFSRCQVKPIDESILKPKPNAFIEGMAAAASRDETGDRVETEQNPGAGAQENAFTTARPAPLVPARAWHGTAPARCAWMRCNDGLFVTLAVRRRPIG